MGMSFNDLSYLKGLGLEELYDPTRKTQAKLTDATFARGHIRCDLIDNEDRLNYQLKKVADTGMYTGTMTPSAFKKLVLAEKYGPANYDERMMLHSVSTMRPYPELKDESRATVEYITELSEDEGGGYAMVTLNLAAGFKLDMATLAVPPVKIDRRIGTEPTLTTVRPIKASDVRRIIRNFGLQFKERDLMDNVLHEYYNIGRIELDVHYTNDRLRQSEDGEVPYVKNIRYGVDGLRPIRGRR
jgi:hypothetical protein